MSKSADALISEIRSRVNRLLHDAVIEHTIVVMRELGITVDHVVRRADALLGRPAR